MGRSKYVHAPLHCPVHLEPLISGEVGALRGQTCGDEYPVREGIPILLPDPDERARVAQTRLVAGTGGGGERREASALDFYNDVDGQDRYLRSGQEETRRDVEAWSGQARVEGPTLEIGSGKGMLQGVGGNYVALDYSFTALATYIDPAHQRVCGTADQMPFPADTFRYVFTITALEHVPRADVAFEEVHRVLKPGGIAYMLPAWHCVQYNCEGIPVRPYRDLTPRQKLIKLTLPVRRHPLVKAAGAVPARLLRRAAWSLAGGGPARLRFSRLRPDYERFWISDSDAASRLDSHEGCLFFQSRGYDVLRPGSSAIRQLFARHGAVIVRKPMRQ